MKFKKVRRKRYLFFVIMFSIILLVGIVYLSINLEILGKITSKENGELFLLNVEIPSGFKQVLPRESVFVEIELQRFHNFNLTDILVSYSIEDMDGNIREAGSESFAIQTRASSVGRVYIFSDTKVGNYILHVKASYDETEAEAIDFFEVVDQKEILMSPKQQLDLNSIMIVLGILLFIFLIWRMKKFKTKNHKRKVRRLGEKNYFFIFFFL